MQVRELMDILQDQAPDAEIELAVVAPVADTDTDVSVDRYTLDAIFPWNGPAPGDPDDIADGDVVWLIGGETKDVDALIDVLEDSVDDT
jgi:hypothetical protein